jgi:hypothetical protein
VYGEIRGSDWQEKGGCLPRDQTPPPNAFYWNHLGCNELTREALGTSKLTGRKAVGDSAPLQAAVASVRSEPGMLTFCKVHLGVSASLGILRLSHTGKAT